ncbi:MAG TPA: MerR family transcriptional regulator [Candidatus Saccharimonadales bacterium]|nr:MerR family transcriptional regulator [Candidatus Saccharimonadales bacterium]
MTCRILGTTDVALRLHCAAERVRQLEREGKLSAVKTPRGVRVFRADDVERLATERELQKREGRSHRAANT